MMIRKAAWLLTASLIVSTIPANFAFAADLQGVEPGIETEEVLVEILPGEEVVPAEEIPAEVIAEDENLQEGAPTAAEDVPAAEEAEGTVPEEEEELQAESGFAASDVEALREEKISGFDKDSNMTIYRNDDGTLAAGWKAVGSKWYYFDPASFAMQTGLKSINGKTYFFDTKGVMLSDSWKTVDGKKYYFRSGGDAQTNWAVLENNWYFFGKDGAMLKGWQKDGGKWFFLDKETGVMQTGWLTDSGKKYYLNNKGMMQTGWGLIDNSWYLFDGSGALLSGWQKVGNSWYYLDKETSVMKTGWFSENGINYYLADNGKMQTGWGKINNQWYLFSGSGSMQKGWQKVGDKWYYLDYNTGVMQTGWLDYAGGWYYLNPSSGVMHKGPTFVNGTLWYLDKNNGWLIENSAGWKRYAGTDKWYFVYNDGHCAVNTKINGYEIDKEGVWYDDPLLAEAMKYSSPTKYLIVADRKRHWAAVFEGSKGNWTKIKGNWRITTGAEETPTPLGEHWVHFKDDSPYGWQGFTESKAAWCSYITGGFYIHSILYVKNYSYEVSPNYTPVLDSDLGENLSHSCIRLKTENAKWVYDNIPLDTKVVVFESTYDY